MSRSSASLMVSGSPRVSVAGPEADGDPMLANELALELLERVGPDAEAGSGEGMNGVYFILAIPRLLTFSFDMDPGVVERLARFGRLVFNLRESHIEARPQRFDRVVGDGMSADGDVDGCSVALVMNGEALDPAAVTAALAVEPTRAHRAGEALDAAGKQLATKGHWCLELESEPATDVNAMARRILARLPEPAAWEAVRRGHALAMHVSFRRSGLTGYFEIEDGLAAELGRLGARLSVWFANYAA